MTLSSVRRSSARSARSTRRPGSLPTAGTILPRNGAGLERVQDVLGHASPATTRVYARLTLSDLADAVAAAPLLGGEPLRAMPDEMPGDGDTTVRLEEGAG